MTVSLRRAEAGDVAALAAIRSSPEVVARWGEGDETDVRESLAGEAHVVLLDGVIVGLVQCHEELDPEYRHASIDVYLSPSVHGRGVGTEAVRQVARLLFDRGHHRITIDPAADNAAAIRCYEKVGFKPVGVMRRYERLVGAGPEDWHDGLLMDLLPEDLAG